MSEQFEDLEIVAGEKPVEYVPPNDYRWYEYEKMDSLRLDQSIDKAFAVLAEAIQKEDASSLFVYDCKKELATVRKDFRASFTDEEWKAQTKAGSAPERKAKGERLTSAYPPVLVAAESLSRGEREHRVAKGVLALAQKEYDHLVAKRRSYEYRMRFLQAFPPIPLSVAPDGEQLSEDEQEVLRQAMERAGIKERMDETSQSFREAFAPLRGEMDEMRVDAHEAPPLAHFVACGSLGLDDDQPDWDDDGSQENQL